MFKANRTISLQRFPAVGIAKLEYSTCLNGVVGRDNLNHLVFVIMYMSEYPDRKPELPAADDPNLKSEDLEESLFNQVMAKFSEKEWFFGRYAHRAFPAIVSLDNFYAKQRRDGFICRELDEPALKKLRLELETSLEPGVKETSG